MLPKGQGRSWWILALCLGLLGPGCQHQDEVRQALRGPLSPPHDSLAVEKIGPGSTPQPKPGEDLPVPGKGKKDLLQIPKDLPCADLPALKPPKRVEGKQKEWEEATRKLYPSLRQSGPIVEPAPGPGGKALSLADLQDLAASNSPVLRKFAADVVAARGAMIQAGAYPNPTASYQAQGQGPGGGPTIGGSLQQTIKTWGKLKLAQAAAEMDLRIAEVALRAAQNDLATQVRTGYFAVLVAQENIFVTEALVHVTARAYRGWQTIALRVGEAGFYEPLQVFVQGEQLQASLTQARNRYVSAWKQLAATLNRAEMPPTLLAGRADAAVPMYRYDRALERILANHTDVRSAELAVQKARYNLRLQEVTPVPDVTVAGTLFNDLSPPGPSAVVASVNVGMNLPVWDLNRGAILQARGQLAHAVEDLQRVRNDLTTRLADAMERYENNRDLVRRYCERKKDHGAPGAGILASQVQVYNAFWKRYQLDPEKVGFADFFVVQQALAGVYQAYLTALQGQWTAVVDVANLLQTNDLYLYGQDGCAEAAPLLPEALELDLPRPARLMPPEIQPESETTK
jgi:cobalt-zinc-cadmium efflux system outer membrane protein